jgi:multidrug efflux pump subunit AcrB
MFHGDGNVQHNTIQHERDKMGENLKAMGKMSHKGASDPVRKNDIKMSNDKNLQLTDTVDDLSLEEQAPQDQTALLDDSPELEAFKKNITARVLKAQAEIDRQRHQDQVKSLAQTNSSVSHPKPHL